MYQDSKQNELLKKFWVSFVFTTAILILSYYRKDARIILLLASIIYFYCGSVFLSGAWHELRTRRLGMMTLVALTASVAYFYGPFWQLSSLITIMLLGQWLAMKATSGTNNALRELTKLLPDKAEVIRNGNTVSLLVSELSIDDIVIVKPGERLPTDGIVIEGHSEVNEQLITGESTPVLKIAGAKVIGGSSNGEGMLKFKVTATGEQTFLSGIMRMVLRARKSKSQVQSLSDKTAFWLTLVTTSGGLVTFVLWIFLPAQPNFAIAFEHLLAVLVIACPPALGLAVPMVSKIAATLAARSGFLIRDQAQFEQAHNIDTVIFDKTGTLTKGEFGVTRIWPVGWHSPEYILKMAMSVDINSNHFVARAIIRRAEEERIEPLDTKQFERVAGMGVRAIVGKSDVALGGLSILSRGQVLPDEISKEVAMENENGRTIIYVLENGEIIGVFALADLVREESREAVRQLHGMGVRVRMITGDSEEVAKWIANQVGIGEYFARVLPQDKAVKVKFLQDQGRKVAMVGNGINDAPALSQANVGIAIGTGTNVAIESAGIILTRNDPRDIPRIISHARRTYAKIKQNLFLASCYNIVALPLAAGALISRDILLTPTTTAILMSVSTIIVILNTLLLTKARYE